MAGQGTAGAAEGSLPFGDLLRRYRAAAGLSQEKLAEQAGLSAHGISDLERGARNRPYRETLERLADSLNLQESQRAALVAAARRSTRAAASPPQTSPGGHSLPVPPTSLIGRETELARLRAQVLDDSTRLLTLTGTGGTGKTRLALELAHEVLDVFSDGVWLVELAPLAEATLVPQAVASLFQLDALPGQTLLEGVARAVASRALLLVLDNCEHVIEACAELCERLLSACPNLKVVATSRELLRIRAEVAWRVPPLRVPDVGHLPPLDELEWVPAVHLFVARVRAMRPDFVLDESNAKVVARICARLDGLPLALELAAARMRVLSAEQVFAHLEDMFRLLAGGVRTASSRQQTMKATLDWSHALLTPQEQVLFRRLAIFAGGWDLPAAEAVCVWIGAADTVDEVAGSQVLDVLTQLADKSLVDVEEFGGDARYRLLEPVRQYARVKLEASGEHQRLAELHAETYLRRAEAVDARQPRRGEREALARDLDNTRVALAWCRSAPEGLEPGLRLASALWSFWDTSGHISEGRRWLTELLAQPAPVPATLGRARALYAAGFLAALQEGLEAARGPTAESLALWEQLCDDRWLGWTRLLDGLIWRFGDPARAVQRGQETLAAGGRVGDVVLSSGALYLLGEARRLQGDSGGAFRLLEEARTLLEHYDGDQFPLGAWILRSLGQVAGQRGDYERATDLLKRRLMLTLQVNDRWDIPGAIESLAWIFTAQGQRERAARLYGAAERLREVGGSTMLGEHAAPRQRRLAILRQEMGDASFTAAWAAGLGMSWEQAVALALADESPTFDSLLTLRQSTGPLTPREREVAVLLAQGRTNRQIAEALVISERTASVHVQHILTRLDLRSRWQVTDWLAAHEMSP